MKLKQVAFVIPFLILIPVLVIYLYYTGYLSQITNRISNRSYAEISDQNGALSIVLSINQSDEPIYSQFISKAGAQDVRKLSLNLNKDTMTNLDQILPKKVMLYPKSDSELDFSSGNHPSLNSSVTGQDYDFATASAKAHFNLKDGKDYSADISDPLPLLIEASRSGNFYLANDLQGLFPILGKVATIRISVDNGEISGEIKLK